MRSVYVVVFAAVSLFFFQLSGGKETFQKSDVELFFPLDNKGHEIDKRHTWIHKEDVFNWGDEDDENNWQASWKPSRSNGARSKNFKTLSDTLHVERPHVPFIFDKVFPEFPFWLSPFIDPPFCKHKEEESRSTSLKTPRRINVPVEQSSVNEWEFSKPALWYVFPESDVIQRPIQRILVTPAPVSTGSIRKRKKYSRKSATTPKSTRSHKSGKRRHGPTKNEGKQKSVELQKTEKHQGRRKSNFKSKHSCNECTDSLLENRVLNSFDQTSSNLKQNENSNKQSPTSPLPPVPQTHGTNPEDLGLTEDEETGSNESIQNAHFSVKKSKKIAVHDMKNLKQFVLQLKDDFESSRSNRTKTRTPPAEIPTSGMNYSPKNSQDYSSQEFPTIPPSNDMNLADTQSVTQNSESETLETTSLESKLTQHPTFKTVVEANEDPYHSEHLLGKSSNDVPPGSYQPATDLTDFDQQAAYRETYSSATPVSLPEFTQYAPVLEATNILPLSPDSHNSKRLLIKTSNHGLKELYKKVQLSTDSDHIARRRETYWSTTPVPTTSADETGEQSTEKSPTTDDKNSSLPQIDSNVVNTAHGTNFNSSKTEESEKLSELLETTTHSAIDKNNISEKPLLPTQDSGKHLSSSNSTTPF